MYSNRCCNRYVPVAPVDLVPCESVQTFLLGDPQEAVYVVEVQVCGCEGEHTSDPLVRHLGHLCGSKCVGACEYVR